MLDFTSQNQIADAFENDRLRVMLNEISNVVLAQAAEGVALEGKSQTSETVSAMQKQMDVKYTPSSQIIQKFLRKTNRRDRRRLVGQMLSRDPMSKGKLSQSEAARMRYLFDPRQKTSVVDRSKIVDRLVPMMKPLKPIDPKDIKGWNRHWNSLLHPSLTAIPRPLNKDGSSSGSGTSSGGGTPAQTFNFLNFRLHEVICDDDTNELGSDEISIDGVGVSAQVEDDIPTPSTNDLIGLTLTDAGKFKTGDRVSYNPPRRVAQFNLAGDDFPRLYICNLAMAEIDNGGFSQFISDLYASIQVEVTAIVVAVGAAVGAAIGAGAAAGSLAGTIAGPVGAIVGLILGAVIGAIIGAIAAALKDEIFEVFPVPLILEDRHTAFNGNNTSPRETATFADYGGRYRLIYSWELA